MNLNVARPEAAIEMQVPVELGSSAAARAASAPTQIISFAIGDDQYGVDIMAVREIKGWSEITHLPRQPESVRGVLNLRGAIVPIIDLRCRFGQGMTEATPIHVVIIVQVGPRMVGLLADRVLDIVSFESQPSAAGAEDRASLAHRLPVRPCHRRNRVDRADRSAESSVPAGDRSRTRTGKLSRQIRPTRINPRPDRNEMKRLNELSISTKLYALFAGAYDHHRRSGERGRAVFESAACAREGGGIGGPRLAQCRAGQQPDLCRGDGIARHLHVAGYRDRQEIRRRASEIQRPDRPGGQGLAGGRGRRRRGIVRAIFQADRAVSGIPP